MNTSQHYLDGEPCPAEIDRALALLGVGLFVLDMDLTEAALEADLLLRGENPHWVMTATIPDTYRPAADGWLDIATAEAALREAVDLLEAHATKAASAVDVLTGTAAVERLLRTLRPRAGSSGWAATRDARMTAWSR